MAKATALVGTGGGFTFGSFVCIFQSFRAILEGREFNTTGFGDAGWIDGEIINGRVTGDAVGVLTTTIPVPAGAFNATFGGGSMKVANVVLTFATGKTWTLAYALVSAVEIERAEEGANSGVYRIRFASAGAVAQAWT